MRSKTNRFFSVFRDSAVRGGAVAVAAALAACNSSSPVASVAPGQDPLSTRLGNLLAFNSTNAPGTAATSAGPRVECPIIQVDPGASSVRVASGEGANGVRYQIAVGDVARECAVQGDKLAIRVGVETNVVLGPSGSPGTYSAPLRIAIVRQKDEAVLASKVYQVGGAVGAAGQSQFTLVADALSVPYINERAADDYEVVIGFGQGGSGARRTRR